MSQSDLEKRVNQFRSLSLPGQPPAMHMGTLYLINDLWNEVQRFQAANKEMQTWIRKAHSVFRAARTYEDLRMAEKYIDQLITYTWEA